MVNTFMLAVQIRTGEHSHRYSSVNIFNLSKNCFQGFFLSEVYQSNTEKALAYSHVGKER